MVRSVVMPKPTRAGASGMKFIIKKFQIFKKLCAKFNQVKLTRRTFGKSEIKFDPSPISGLM